MAGVMSSMKNFRGGIYSRLLFVVLAFLLMIASSCLYVSNMLHYHFSKETVNMLNYAKLRINSDLILAETVLENLSGNIKGIIERGGDEADVSQYIREYVEYMKSDVEMKKLRYYNVFGYFYMFSDDKGKSGVYISGEKSNLPADYDATKRPWFESAIMANGGVAIEPVYKLVDPDKYVMSYSRCVFDDESNAMFILGLNLTLDSINEYIIEMQPTKNSYGFLESQNDDIIAHPNPEFIGKNISELNSELSGFISEIRTKTDTFEYKTTIHKDRKEIVFASRLDNNWILSVVIPEGEYYQELVKMIVIISVLGSILAFVLIVILMRVDKAKKKADEIVRRQNALLESEKIAMEKVGQTHLMLDSTPLCCKLWNRDLEVFACNEEAVRFFDLSSKQEFCERFFELCPEFQPNGRPTGEMAREYLKKAFEEGYQRFEWLHQKLDGELIPTEITLVRVMYKDDYVVAGYIRDLTEQKRMIDEIAVSNRLNEIQLAELMKLQKELENESHMLQTMFDCIPDLIFCKDMDLKYTRCNKSLLEYFAINKEDLIGKNDENGLGIPESIAKEFRNMDRKVINENRVLTYEESIPGSNGVEKVFETKKVPIMYNGTATGIMGIARDITERKAMEEAIHSANRAKSEFLANMSHEMRTPLNVVVGLTDLHMEDDPHGAIHNDIKKINNAGNILLSIVNDVLDISKIEAGKLELVPVQYDTASLFNDIITLNMIRIESKPIVFNIEIDAGIPCHIYGDELRLKQIFNNLLSNAFKYTHKGSVTFSVHCERDGDKDIWMYISVSDTGIGIRPEDVKKLFSDYNQVDTRANRKIEGTGLGLAITKKLAALMGGEISVESEYGKGTTFRVRVRQTYVDGKPIGPEIAENLRSFHYMYNKQHVSSKLVRVDMSYAKVLVVDDMPTNLDVAAGLMRKYKMQVDCLSSGQDAIDRINSGKPVYNAIFMDHMMPQMDGIEATTKIRELNSEYAKTVPIISLTANATVGNEQMFLKSGFQDFLSKPIDILRLDAILRKWVRDKSKETAVAAQQYLPDPGTAKSGQSIKIPGIDERRGLALYGGDLDLYLTVLRSFTVNTPSVINNLHHVTEEKLRDYAIYVHCLKGSCSNIGAETLREKTAHMETAAKAGNIEEVLAQNDNILDEAEMLVEDICTWLNEQGTGNKKPHLQAPDPALLESLRQYCEQYDMNGVDTVMEQLENACYDNGGDLILWMREMANISDLPAIAERIQRGG